MRSTWIFLFLIVIQYGSCYIDGQNFKGYVQTSDMGWFQARRRCIEEGNADMFDPSERRHLKQSHVVNNTYYWVGGFETSQWRWTDNSPLFTNNGFCDVPTDLENEDIKEIPYNSVLGCYRKCKKYTIGLNGSKCYCFDESDQLTCSEENGNTTMCFGNPMDQCGNESSMSVYHVDVPFKLDGDANYQCACLKLSWYWYGNIELHPYDCDKSLSSICVKEANKKFVRCRNGLCLSPKAAPWTSSNQSCSLAKFSFSKEDDFIDLQWISHFRWYLSWIGLHKQRSRHWVDGKTEQLDFGNSDQDLRCLALMKTDGRWSEYWIPCNENHQSLCSSEEHSVALDSIPETPPSTVVENDIPGTSSQTTKESEIGQEHELIENDNGKIGIYAGVSVGCLVVLAVIGTIVMFKRKRLFCFTRREDVNTTSRENIAYMSSNNLENQDALHGGGKRGFGDLTTDQNRPDSVNEVNTYYNISKTVPMSTVDTGNHNNNFSSDRENYNTVHRIANFDENAYQYIKPQPQIKFMADNLQHDAWNQTGINHVVEDGTGLSRQNVKTYNHLNGSGSGTSSMDAGHCYNNFMADAESDFDSTVPPEVVNAENHTYSNISPMGECQGTDIEVKMSMKDRPAENFPDYYNL